MKATETTEFTTFITVVPAGVLGLALVVLKRLAPFPDTVPGAHDTMHVSNYAVFMCWSVSSLTYSGDVNEPQEDQ